MQEEKKDEITVKEIIDVAVFVGATSIVTNLGGFLEELKNSWFFSFAVDPQAFVSKLDSSFAFLSGGRRSTSGDLFSLSLKIHLLLSRWVFRAFFSEREWVKKKRAFRLQRVCELCDRSYVLWLGLFFYSLRPFGLLNCQIKKPFKPKICKVKKKKIPRISPHLWLFCNYAFAV